MDNFDPNQPAQWLAFSIDPAATNPYPNGFDPNAFRIDTSGFVNSFNGSFALMRNGNDIFPTYTPIPEPAALFAVAAMAAGLVGVVRRRRRPSGGHAQTTPNSLAC
jgi:hypothetical protein